MNHCTRNLVALVLLGTPALASDFYVDAVNGNDANAGTSPAIAWKTLSHAAVASPPLASTTVHAAPGTYASATGEIFPLRFQHQHIVADQGLENTIIDGAGTNQPLVKMEYIVQMGPSITTWPTELRGFTLRNAAMGIFATNEDGLITSLVSDCRLETLEGVSIAVFHTPFSNGGAVALTLQRVDIAATSFGVRMSSGYQITLTAEDCSIRGSSTGVYFNSAAVQVNATFTRCRIESVTGNAVFALPSVVQSIDVTFQDCVIAHNGAGFVATPNQGSQFSTVAAHFRRCTIADNAGVGVQNQGFPAGLASTWFESTIVDGNNPDTMTSNVVGNTYSSLSGTDPLFVDRTNGDYRLRFGSPCIDAGDPATGVGTLDIARVARSIDGDLDTHERADIGAYEFTPLRLVTSGKIGTPLRLESSGESGGTSTIYFTRGTPFAPMTTPFGEFDLNPSSFGTLLHTSVAPYPPIGFQRPIPNLAYLIGRTFSFQGLTTSSVAPQGSAYTNVVSVTITP